MMLVAEVIRSLPASATLAEFCHAATSALHAMCDRHGIPHERLLAHPEERPTASAAVFSLHRREVWLVGDCQCIVNGTYHDNPKPGEAPIALHRSQLIHQMLADGTATTESLMCHDSARDIIVPDIVATCHDQNKTFAVLDGFDVALQHVAVIETGETGEVVLATDGYPFLHPTLEASEAALAHLLTHDPLCIDEFLATKGLLKGNKSFDDRSLLKLIFKGSSINSYSMQVDCKST